MGKKIFQGAVIFFLAVGGTIVGQLVLLPHLAQDYRGQWPALLGLGKGLSEKEVKVFPTQEIRIQENTALTEAVAKTEKVVVGVRTKIRDNKVLEGSGLVLTSDGLVVTLTDLLGPAGVLTFWLEDQQVSFKILKTQAKGPLALVRLEKQGLATAGFGDLAKIKKGQRVFLVGVVFVNGRPEKVVNEGIIRRFDQGLIETNIIEKPALKGSVLFDIEGRILGLNYLDQDNRVLSIPIDQVRRFAGF